MKCVQPAVADELELLPHVGDKIAGRLRDRGLPTFTAVAMAGVDFLKTVPGVADHRAGRIWVAAIEQVFGVDTRGVVDDLCEVGEPFTEAESADLARAGVHTFQAFAGLTVDQLVEITGVSAVDAAAAINQATYLFSRISAAVAVECANTEDRE